MKDLASLKKKDIIDALKRENELSSDADQMALYIKIIEIIEQSSNLLMMFNIDAKYSFYTHSTAGIINAKVLIFHLDDSSIEIRFSELDRYRVALFQTAIRTNLKLLSLVRFLAEKLDNWTNYNPRFNRDLSNK